MACNMSWLFCVGIGNFSHFPTDRIHSFSSLICVHYHNVRPTMRAVQLTEKEGVAWAVWLHHHRLFELSHYLPDRITLSPQFEHSQQTIINFNKTSNWNNHRTKLWNCHLVPFVRQKIVFKWNLHFEMSLCQRMKAWWECGERPGRIASSVAEKRAKNFLNAMTRRKQDWVEIWNVLFNIQSIKSMFFFATWRLSLRDDDDLAENEKLEAWRDCLVTCVTRSQLCRFRVIKLCVMRARRLEQGRWIVMLMRPLEDRFIMSFLRSNSLVNGSRPRWRDNHAAREWHR